MYQVEVTGLPKPKVKWFQGESHLTESARVSLETAGSFSYLKVLEYAQFKVHSHRTKQRRKKHQFQMVCWVIQCAIYTEWQERSKYIFRFRVCFLLGVNESLMS